MKLTSKQTSIFLIFYVAITLFLRFWLESKIMIGIIPSLILGLVLLLPAVYLWRKNVLGSKQE